MSSSTSAKDSARIRFYLFGHFRIERGSRSIQLPTRKTEALLAYLVLNPEKHAREKLAGTFWGESAEAEARNSLRNAPATINKELGRDLVLADRQSVGLNPEYPLWVDALEFEGQFGPGVKGLIPAFYFGMGASEPKILEFFANVGVNISKGELSNLLIENQDEFHAESEAVYESGLRSSAWQHTDDTLTRVNGQNQHCHVVCNPVYSVYRTLAGKDRLSVLDVLRNGRPRRFRLNQDALACLESVQLSQETRQTLRACCSEMDMDEASFQEHLRWMLPRLGKQQRKEITAAAAIAAYWAEREWPVIDILLCDDAPQFNKLTRWNVSGTTTTNCWPTNKTPVKQNASAWKLFLTIYSPRRPDTRPWMSALQKREPKSLPCCWC